MWFLTLLNTLLEGVVRFLPFFLVSRKSEQVGELKAETGIQKATIEANRRAKEISDRVDRMSSDDIDRSLYDRDN